MERERMFFKKGEGRDTLEKIPRGPLGLIGRGQVIGKVFEVSTLPVRVVYAGWPDVEITSQDPIDGGMRYTVDGTGVLPSLTRVRLMSEAIPGFVNFATDNVEVESMEQVVNRHLRKQWRAIITVTPKRK